MPKYRLWIVLSVFIAGLFSAITGFAKVSEKEAARLGKDLTWCGATQAGNSEGTIPPWTGGMTWENTPDLPRYNGTKEHPPNPFAQEKPIITITSKNVQQYKDKLAPGQLMMFKKYPEFYMLVYPTHRTSTYIRRLREATVANATRAGLSEDGLGPVGAKGGFPFPIPQNGAEAILNFILAPTYLYLYTPEAHTYIVNPNGSFVDSGSNITISDTPFHHEETAGDEIFRRLYIEYISPPRRKGEIILLIDKINGDRSAWLYQPGQRRVRRAPSIAYDTPNPGAGNLETFDDGFVYSGKIDRYDWKLLGKKEMFILANNYGLDKLTKKELLTPLYINPKHMRYELHRVWVVEATLKPGKRHIYEKRVFYIDEDSWVCTITDKYDGRGDLWRTTQNTQIQSFHTGNSASAGLYNKDWTTDAYPVGLWCEIPQSYKDIPEMVDTKLFTPEGLRRAGRR